MQWREDPDDYYQPGDAIGEPIPVENSNNLVQKWIVYRLCDRRRMSNGQLYYLAQWRVHTGCMPKTWVKACDLTLDGFQAEMKLVDAGITAKQSPWDSFLKAPWDSFLKEQCDYTGFMVQASDTSNCMFEAFRDALRRFR